MKPLKVLVSGFEPSFGIKKTPSGQITKLLMSGMLSQPGVEIYGIVLPQIFRLSGSTLISRIIEVDPDYVIMLGATPGHNTIRVERFAVNVEHSLSGDNTQIPVVDREIVPGGPPAMRTDVDCLKIVEHLVNNGIHAETSYHAGTHTCNSLYYEILTYVKNTNINCSPVFVHMPYPNEYGVLESSSPVREADLVKAVVTIIQFLAVGQPSRVMNHAKSISPYF